jgi:amidohydrolase
VLAGATRAFALHCDPSLQAGKVGLRTGSITAACDRVDVTLTGPGGHTARPQLTVDLVDALARVVTEVPGLLSRQVDPRAGMSLVWGAISAGTAANAIPQRGVVRGTLRVLDRAAWDGAELLVRSLVERVAAASGAGVEVEYVRGVPPVVNDFWSTTLLARAVERSFGDDAHVGTAQSLGGEDFAWYLGHVPGAMGRLGTRTPGGPTYDLHQGDLRVDERAISVGATVLAGAAIEAMVTER